MAENIFDVIDDLDAKILFDSIKDDNVDHISLERFLIWYPSFASAIKKTHEEKVLQTPVPPQSSSSSSVGAKRGGGGTQLALTTEPKAKKAKKTTETTATEIDVPAKLSSAKKSALLKSIVTSLQSSIKSKKFYDHDTTEECSAECVMSPGSFATIIQFIITIIIIIITIQGNSNQSIFGNIGTVIVC